MTVGTSNVLFYLSTLSEDAHHALVTQNLTSDGESLISSLDEAANADAETECRTLFGLL